MRRCITVAEAADTAGEAQRMAGQCCVSSTYTCRPAVQPGVLNSSPSWLQVALLSKHAIILADAKLKSSCTVHETIRVKSAAWSDAGVLLYTTLNHIKYCLPSGDSGIVKTLDQPVYIVAVVGDKLHVLDREGKTKTIQVRRLLA